MGVVGRYLGDTTVMTGPHATVVTWARCRWIALLLAVPFVVSAALGTLNHLVDIPKMDDPQGMIVCNREWRRVVRPPSPPAAREVSKGWAKIGSHLIIFASLVLSPLLIYYTQRTTRAMKARFMHSGVRLATKCGTIANAELT